MEEKIFKCECGKIFEEKEIKFVHEYHGFDWGNTRKTAVCPKCNSTYFEEVEYCEHCENYFQDVQNGICENCLKKIACEIDYEQGFEYICHNNDLPMFVFEYVFNSTEPSKISSELEKEVKIMFERKKIEDIIFNKTFLLDAIKEYIEADVWQFSDYLKIKGVI